MEKRNLWLALEHYNFRHVVPAHLWDQVTEAFGGVDASTKAFANKIARKLGWTPRFALRAISEYKKFVFLGVTSEFSVTPSKVIDQVWHEHLLFSKGYREFCSDVICYTFDHNPELVPMTDQTGTFSAQYIDTISLYKTEFGVDPPADIWSVPKFDKKILRRQGYESKKKIDRSSDASYTDSGPLFLLFDSPHDLNLSHSPEFDGFGGGVGGGAGASGTWESNNSFESSNAYSDSSSSSDPSGTDSGSSCSSCSSGCGGGGSD